MHTERCKSRTVLAVVLLALVGVASPAFAETVLYSATGASPYRIGAGSVAGGLVNVLYDDVAVHNPQLHSHAAISEITIGVRRSISGQSIELSWAALDGTAAMTVDALVRPRNILATLPVPGGPFINELVLLTYTPPEPVLVPLDNTFHSSFAGGPYGSFAIGVRPSNGLAFSLGWAVAFPDSGFVNDQLLMWVEAPEAGTIDVFSSGPDPSVVPTTTYLVIKGTLVPAPGALTMLAACGLLTLQRRSRGRSD